MSSNNRIAFSKLYDQTNFYDALTNDILKAKEEIIIYSPFVSRCRAETFKILLDKLKGRSIKVFIFTRPPSLSIGGDNFRNNDEIIDVLGQYEERGATIYYLDGSIHEKVAIIDREILWEGSLNILSQWYSREMMRRIPDKNLALEVIHHLRLTEMMTETQRVNNLQLDRTRSDGTLSEKDNTLTAFILLFGLILVAWWDTHDNAFLFVLFIAFLIGYWIIPFPTNLDKKSSFDNSRPQSYGQDRQCYKSGESSYEK